jgi:signal transduction histidine kinase
VAVVVSFALTIVAFVASRVITEVQSRRVQGEAASISDDALAATETLVGTRTNLRTLVFDMNTLRAGAGSQEVVQQLGVELDVSRRDAVADWAKYLALPFYPGERELVERVKPDIIDAERAIADVSERLHAGDRAVALKIAEGRAVPSIERADEGLGRLIELNAHEARDSATAILASRRPWGLLPEILGACFAATAAYFGVRLLLQYLRWARERSAELEQFAGRVAHDIRSPLGSASLALEIAQRAESLEPRTRDLLVRASGTMQRIAKLVDGLLVFATSGGYMVPGHVGEPKTTASDVLAGVVEDVRLEADAKNIRIDYEPPPPSLIMACSPGVLISMTTNLVANAMKFMGDASRRLITVSGHQVGDQVEIDVSDTGPGVPPELRDRVFDPYVRGDANVPGLGLGLATVRRLAEAHGGSVGVDQNPEGGSRFWFRVPSVSYPGAQ